MPRVKTGNKRRKILEAATELLYSGSYRDVGIDQIAKKAGVASGTIYLYFKSKDDILMAIYKGFMKEYNQTLWQKLEELATPQEKFRYLIHSDLFALQNQPERARIFLIEMRQSAACLAFIKDHLIQRYEDILEFIFKEQMTGEDRHLLAVLLSGMLENLHYDWILNGQQISMQLAEDALYSGLIKVLRI